MPMKVGKPNLSGQLKTSFRMSVPRGGAQKAARHGEILSNNKIVTTKGGGKVHNSGKPSGKKPRSMY